MRSVCRVTGKNAVSRLQYLLHFCHSNNDYAKAPQYYVIRALPVISYGNIIFNVCLIYAHFFRKTAGGVKQCLCVVFRTGFVLEPNILLCSGFGHFNPLNTELNPICQ